MSHFGGMMRHEAWAEDRRNLEGMEQSLRKAVFDLGKRPVFVFAATHLKFVVADASA